MKNKHRLLLTGLLAAVLALAVGIGLALAQSGGSTQPGPRPGFRGRVKDATVAGVVTQVKDNTITVKTAARGDKSVKVDNKTVYVKQGGKAALADVTPGERVRIKLVQPAGSGDTTAKVVMIGKFGKFRHKHGKRKGVAGNITTINGNSVTIHTAGGDKQFTLPQLTQGERIGVITRPDGSVAGVMYNQPQKPAGPPAGQGGNGGDQSQNGGQTGGGQAQTSGQTQTNGQGA